MLGYDLVEVLEVTSLLVVHVFHERAKMRMGSDCGWSLSLIYENSGKFASLIYSELETVSLVAQIIRCINWDGIQQNPGSVLVQQSGDASSSLKYQSRQSWALVRYSAGLTRW